MSLIIIELILFLLRIITAVSCGSPPSISNGSPGAPTRTTFGGTVTYACNYGYRRSGSANVTCQASGSWSTRPSCGGEQCACMSLIIIKLIYKTVFTSYNNSHLL